MNNEISNGVKNKFIFLFLFLGMMFFAGIFSVKIANGASTCGASEKGSCEAGSFSCPDGMSSLSGGRDCASGYRCCIEDDLGNTSKALEGERCGASEAGICMQASMLMCPTGYSSVSGGTDCGGLSLKCCAIDNTNITQQAQCKEKGMTYNVDTKTCEESAGPGQKGTGSGGSAGSGSVKPLGKIDIPTDLGLPNNTVAGVLKNLLSWLLGIVGILALMGFLISGIQYLLAYSNEELAETAKKNMTYSVMGITIALAGFIIIQAINLALQGTPWF